MTREATVKLNLDIKPWLKATEDAKKSVEDLGKVDLSRKLRRALGSDFAASLNQHIERYQKGISAATERLTKMSSAGDKAFNAERAQRLARRISELNRGLRETQRIQRSLSRMGGIGEMAGRAASFGRQTIGGAGHALGAVGLGLGVGAAVSRSLSQARTGLALREVAGGGITSDRSLFGFTREERRERGLEVARGLGRDLTRDELDRSVDLGELLQRGFGVSGDQFGGALGAARRGGVEQESDFVAGAIGDAVAIRLSGSAVGEYLQAMTTYMESISKGVNIDDESLRGFAGSLGSLDFFRKDPGRIFDALRGLEAAFKGRGDYQDFLAYRAVQEAGGANITPAGVELRRQMGLFGDANPEDMRGLRPGSEIRQIAGIGGNELIQSMMSQVMGDVRDMDDSSGLLSFMNATNLQFGQALPMFARLRGQQQSGQPIRLTQADTKKIKDAAKEGGKTPEERAQENMKTFEGSVVSFGKRVDDMQNTISDFITEGVTDFVGVVDEFSEATGMFKSDVEKLGLILAAYLGAKGAGSILGGGLGGALGGGVFSKMLPLLKRGIPVVGAAAAGAAIGKGIVAILDSWTPGWQRDVVDLFTGQFTKNKNMERGLEIQKELGPERMLAGVEKAGLPPSKIDKVVEIIVDAENQRAKDIEFNEDISAGRKMNRFGMSPRRRSVTDVPTFEEAIQMGMESGAFEDAEEKNEGGVVGYYQSGGRAERARAIMRGAFGVGKGRKRRKKKKSDDAGVVDWLRDQFKGGTAADRFTKSIGQARSRYDGGAVYLDRGGLTAIQKVQMGAFGIGKKKKKKKRDDDERGVLDWIKGQLKGGGAAERFTRSIEGARKRNTGGPVYLHDGGPMGTDTVPAWLTPGEFVVSTRGVSQNMAALEHANKGGKIAPVYRQEGGMIGSTSISGDPTAINSNTEALQNLTLAIIGLVQQRGSLLRDVPRGASDMRYGIG